MGFKSKIGSSPLIGKSVEQWQAADPRITWDQDMAKQANLAAKGKQPPPYQAMSDAARTMVTGIQGNPQLKDQYGQQNNAFTSQQIGQALRQQALQQEALRQQPQQPSGWGTLT